MGKKIEVGGEAEVGGEVGVGTVAVGVGIVEVGVGTDEQTRKATCGRGKNPHHDLRNVPRKVVGVTKGGQVGYIWNYPFMHIAMSYSL